MADFKAGDRVVKMSGAAAGKYGTVNSVREDGTLNVTFDGERLPRYCDPERCGQVAVNAVEFTNPNYRPEAGMRFLDENFSMFDPKVAKAMIEDARRKGVKVPPGVIEKARRAGLISNAVRNERIRAYPDGPGEWILVDEVGDEGIGRTTATDERGIKAQLADIAVRTYRWHRPEIVIMREKYYSNAARNARAANARILDQDGRAVKVGDRVRLAGTSSHGLGKVGVVLKIDGDWGDVTVKTEDGKTYEYEASAVVKIVNSARNAVPIYAAHVGPMMGKPSAWAVVDPMAKEIKSFLSLYDAAKSGRNKRSAARAILLWGELRDYVIFEMAGRKATEKAGTTWREMERKKEELWRLYGFKDYNDLIANR